MFHTSVSELIDIQIFLGPPQITPLNCWFAACAKKMTLVMPTVAQVSLDFDMLLTPCV